MSDQLAVVFEVDGVLPWAPLRTQARRLRGLLRHDSSDRRSVLGMSGVLQGLVNSAPDTPVHYLSGSPARARAALVALLHEEAYPAGSLHLTGRPGLLPRRAGVRQRGKLQLLQTLLLVRPERRWVLVGDNGQDDPELFARLDRQHPGQVAAVALRAVTGGAKDPGQDPPGRVSPVRAPNAEELLPLLRTALGLRRPDSRGPQDWLLTARERGNDATAVQAFTRGNAVRALLHGRSYFAALADQLDQTGPGDLVLLLGWRADADQQLTTDGVTLGAALTAAATRGALVRGLLWRSHASQLGYSTEENRRLSTVLRRVGGQVLLDMRIRGRGSHHQKLVVLRHPGKAHPDVAFLGGIDLAHGRGDDAAHHGDPQTTRFAAGYGATPAWHDVQLQLHGPAVGDAEQTFRERWDDPAALVRLPWHLVPDRLRGLPRTAAPLPPASPAPVAPADPAPLPPADPAPAADGGTCAVQLLRTYPWRWPAHPFAPRGERSIARAYAKALDRAQRLVYLEDQYLWSVDVARVFAAALHRAPGLQLIAVVPRYCDDDGLAYSMSARYGHAEALAMVQQAGRGRVQVLDVENEAGLPVYVHAKVCVVDDVWAAVGSDNFNLRSWTHDSELTAAVVDEQRDDREPLDPGGLGDGARRFARELRLQLLREHLDTDRDADLLDPDRAAATIRARAAEMDAWHHAGQTGPRPRGRLRVHPPPAPVGQLPAWRRRLADPLYRQVLDPDGRPLGMRLRRTY